MKTKGARCHAATKENFLGNMNMIIRVILKKRLNVKN